jgi:hypothetical protein
MVWAVLDIGESLGVKDFFQFSPNPVKNCLIGLSVQGGVRIVKMGCPISKNGGVRLSKPII